MSDQSQPGDLDLTWIHGSDSSRRRRDPPWQAHRYREDTFIIRQSKDFSFEAPFVFLLLGEHRALLLDTGATNDDHLRRVVDGVLDDWLRQHPRRQYQLVVAHTHGHRDHVAGDDAFLKRPDTVVVGTSVEEVCEFFGIGRWPQQVVGFELGDRRVDVVGVPGHHPASVAVHDHRTGLLLTGDTLYPGRLYVFDVPAFTDSIKRLADFVSTRTVTHVLGCHIEMTRDPGRDYYPGCRYQPDEPPLQLSVEHVRVLADAVASPSDLKGVRRFDQFVLYLGMGPLTQAGLAVRGLSGSLHSWLSRRGTVRRALSGRRDPRV